MARTGDLVKWRGATLIARRQSIPLDDEGRPLSGAMAVAGPVPRVTQRLNAASQSSGQWMTASVWEVLSPIDVCKADAVVSSIV